MRIAHFHTDTMMTYSTILAIPATLRRMGHEVFEGAIPTDAGASIEHHLTPRRYQAVVAAMPSWEDLQTCDAILLSAPEYYHPWLDHLYREERWCSLKVPRVALWAETSQREDNDYHYENLRHWANIHFYPAPEDVARFQGYKLGPYIDTTVFRPCALSTQAGHFCDESCRTRRLREKRYDAAFVGSLYPKRIEFLNRLAPYLGDIDFRVANIAVRDLSGERKAEWVDLMAENLRQIRVHVALPSNNTRMLVGRPVETMACGSFVLTYRTPDTTFRDGEHYREYDPDRPEELAELIRYYMEHEDERETIAQAGCQEVHQKYSLHKWLSEVLDVVATHR